MSVCMSVSVCGFYTHLVCTLATHVAYGGVLCNTVILLPSVLLLGSVALCTSIPPGRSLAIQLHGH